MIVVPALVVVVLVGFAGALQSDFAYDDYRLIVRNEALAAPGAFVDAFRGDYYRSTLDIGRLGYYRPLAVALNVVDRRLWGLDAGGYHLTNLILHILATLLCWALLRRLTGEPWAALAAALFAVHPARAESVTFISGRVDVLAGLFYLATLWILAAHERPGPGRLTLAALAAAGALLAKEMAITLVVVAPLLVLLRPRLIRGSTADGLDRSGALRTLAATGVVVILVVIGRVLAMGELTRHVLAAPVTWAPRLVNTVGAYLGALIAPSWDLRLEPPLALEAWSATTAAGGLLVAAVLVLVVTTWRRAPVVAFGGAATLVAFLPVSQLVALETGWAERFTYIPAAMAAVAVAGGLAGLAAWRSDGAPGRASGRRLRRALLLGCGVLLVVEIAALWNRNRAWHDDETLWDAVVASGRVSAKAFNNRGVNRMERGELGEAADAYRRALALDPAIATAHFNLGVVFWAEGRLDSALARVRTACALRPHDVDFALRRGAIAQAAGAFGEAAAAYQAALDLRPEAVEAWLGLASALRRDGQLDRAFAADRRALELDPGSREALFGLALDHFTAGDLDGCEAWCERLLALEPAHAGALFQRGRVCEERGETTGALEDYQASAVSDPSSVAARVRAARLLAALGRPCDAGAAFAAAAEIAPEREAGALSDAAAAMREDCARSR